MGDGVFSIDELALNPGTNQIVMEALDAAGNSTRVERVVVWTPVRSLVVKAAAEVQEGQRLVFPVTIDSPGDVAEVGARLPRATLLQCKLIHSSVSLLCATGSSFKTLQLVKSALSFVQSRSDIHVVDPSLQVWLLQHVGRMHRDRKELSIALSFFRRASDCAAEVLSSAAAPADINVEGPSVPDLFSDDNDRSCSIPPP
jgi:hypothetical protein